MSVQTRGGIPRVRNLTVTVAGVGAQPLSFKGLSMHLHVRTATFPVRLYFSQDDFDNDENYWEVAIATPFDQPLEERCVWMKGVGGTAVVDVLTLYRKG